MAESSRKRLVGKVAIVSGSGRGIGRCEAMLLAQQGAKVVVNDIGKDPDGSRRANKVAERNPRGGRRSGGVNRQHLDAGRRESYGRDRGQNLWRPGYPGQQRRPARARPRSTS